MIEIKNIHKSFGDNHVLKIISFKFEKGKTNLIIGESGSGKTTVINLLPRFFDSTAGQMTIDGIDLRQISVDALRRNIALVSQDSVLFDDTVAANIAFGCPDASRDEIMAAAKAAAAHDFIMGLDGGYDAPVGTMGNRLSGGQRQRAALPPVPGAEGATGEDQQNPTARHVWSVFARRVGLIVGNGDFRKCLLIVAVGQTRRRLARDIAIDERHG